MSNPTSNFGWQMPTNTDLVTNLPADFEVFGQAVDSDFADLKGGTSGQILSKNSATDLDFVWIDNQVGDITSVTATTPLTGGGTGGDITVGIQDGTTAQKGAVQLTDSTSSTSTTTAATPNAVKSAFDLATTASSTATAAIPKSIVTTAGDLLIANGSASLTRLGIGANNTYLKSNGTTASWASVASTSGLNLISKTTISAANTTNVDNVFTSTYRNYKVVFVGTSTGGYANFRLRAGGSTNSTANYQMWLNRWNGANASQLNQNQINSIAGGNLVHMEIMELLNPQTTDLTQYFKVAQGWANASSGELREYLGLFNGTNQFDGISFFMDSGTATGTLYIYGYGE